MKILTIMYVIIALLGVDVLAGPRGGGIIGNGRPIDYFNPLLHFSVRYPENWHRISLDTSVAFTPPQSNKKSVVRFSIELSGVNSVDELWQFVTNIEPNHKLSPTKLDGRPAVIVIRDHESLIYVLNDNREVISILFSHGDHDEEIRDILSSIKLS